MANRYQSFSFTTASVASGVVLQASQVLGPHVYNLVKLKIVRNTGAGNINFRIFKKGVWGSTNRLARWENQAVPLLQPVDKTSGSPGIEALEGIPLPVDDEDGTNFDGTGKLHHELENLGTTSTFTISGEYEEVVVLSGAGDPSWRGAVSALTSLTLRGATSGAAIIAAPAAASGPTLTLPTASGTFARLQDKLSAFAATTSAELAGVISDETGSGALVFATSPTFVTPTLDVATATRLGLGAAADANIPLYATRSGLAAQFYNSAAVSASGQPVLRLRAQAIGSTVGSGPRIQFSETSDSLVGEIGAFISDATHIGLTFSIYNVGMGEVLRLAGAGTVQPGSDNAQDFGVTSLRWKTGYFGTSLGIGVATAPNAVGLHVLKASADSGIFLERTTDVATTAKIYIDANGDLVLWNLNNAKKIDFVANNVTPLVIDSTPTPRPGVDNTFDFGSASFRWKDGYFAGTLRYGTFTATPGSITGYITITDAGGTTRKLAVTT